MTNAQKVAEYDYLKMKLDQTKEMLDDNRIRLSIYSTAMTQACKIIAEITKSDEDTVFDNLMKQARKELYADD